LNHPVVLYDGMCNLCSGVVAFTLRRNQKGHLRYAALQSESGRNILRECGLDSDRIDSFVLVENGAAYMKSSAALRLAKHLGGAWPLASALLVVPRFLRDAAYDFVARNRYRWFGRRQSCLLMRPEFRSRFLE
jgi:predicted DCC family thiol-disulfide oxidoreductase YuxK